MKLALLGLWLAACASCATAAPSSASSGSAASGSPSTAAAGASTAAPASGGAAASAGAPGAATTTTATNGKRSLYDRLGGLPAIDAVVGDFLANVAGDTRIQHRFALTDLKDLKLKLVDQVCMATGGPCTYKGGDMKTVHKGMRIKSAEFDALVEDLIKSLDKFKVPATEKGELLGALGPMKADIVEEP